MDIVECLNIVLANGIMAQEGDAAEIIGALEYYGFKIVPAAEIARLRAALNAAMS